MSCDRDRLHVEQIVEEALSAELVVAGDDLRNRGVDWRPSSAASPFLGQENLSISTQSLLPRHNATTTPTHLHCFDTIR